MIAVRLSPKEKIGLMIALSIMSFTFLDRLIVNPINNKIKRINREIKVTQAQLAFDLINVSQKEAIAKEFEKYAKYQKDAGSDEEKITVMLSALEDVGRDSGLTLLDIKPQQSDKDVTFKKYSIAVEAEGSVEQLISFLYKLNTSDNLYRVEKLRLNVRDKNAQQIKASIMVTKIFVF